MLPEHRLDETIDVYLAHIGRGAWVMYVSLLALLIGAAVAARIELGGRSLLDLLQRGQTTANCVATARGAPPLARDR